MIRAGISPFEPWPPRLAIHVRHETRTTETARFWNKPLRSLQITFHTRNGHGGRDSYQVAGARPCAKLAAFGRESGAEFEQTRNMRYHSG